MPEVAIPDSATLGVSPAVAASEHDDNEKLEQLAKKLYDKVSDRIKAELRLDRERWGRITDLAR